MNNEVVLFCNGCFDLFHFGHLQFLEECKKHCDFLIVGINSDYSVQSIKGKHRPIIPQYERARIIKALECVDEVLIFNELTACAMIEALNPDIYAKSYDYKDSGIPEFQTAVEIGAQIMLVKPESYAEDIHTSGIIKRIIDKELGR